LKNAHIRLLRVQAGGRAKCCTACGSESKRIQKNSLLDDVLIGSITNCIFPITLFFVTMFENMFVDSKNILRLLKK